MAQFLVARATSILTDPKHYFGTYEGTQKASEHGLTAMPTSQRRENTLPTPAGPPKVLQMPHPPPHPVPMQGQHQYHPGEAMNELAWYQMPYGYGTPAFHYPPPHTLGPGSLVPMHAPQAAVPNLVATQARPAGSDLDTQRRWANHPTTSSVAPVERDAAPASTTTPRQFKNPMICDGGK